MQADLFDNETKRYPAKLYRGDCLDLMDSLSNLDVIVTSPPYNLDIKYRSYKDSRSRDEFLNWMSNVAKSMKTCLKESGSLFLNVGSSNKDPWIAFDIANQFRSHFVLQNNIVWVKSHTTKYKDIGEINFGHFKPINSKRYSNHLFEHVFHFTKNGDVHVDRLALGAAYTDKSNSKRWKSAGDKRCRGNIWCIPYETIKSRDKDRGGHPATFPPQLAEWAIRFHGLKNGMLVYDPFVGTGSSLVAAYQLGAMGIGSDLDDEYLKMAEKRLPEYVYV